MEIDFDTKQILVKSDRVSVFSKKIKKILQSRMNSLKQLSNIWLNGDIRKTIRELSLIKDQSVSCDFF